MSFPLGNLLSPDGFFAGCQEDGHGLGYGTACRQLSVRQIGSLVAHNDSMRSRTAHMDRYMIITPCLFSARKALPCGC